MKKKFLGMGRPSASMVVAVAALGVGLAGGASAAGDLITGADIKNGSITGADIKNGSVRFQDLTPSTRARLLGADGPAVAGPAGATGTKGDNGAQGEQGPAGRDALTYVTALDGTKGSQGWEDEVYEAGAVRLDGHLVLGKFPDGTSAAWAKLTPPALKTMKLRDIKGLSFSERASGGIDGYNAPYVNLVTTDATGAKHRVTYSPSTQAGGPGSTMEWRRHNVTQGSVRWDDPAGNNPDISWAKLIAEHGDETVYELRVQAGNAGSYSDGSTTYADDVVLIAGDHVARYDFE